MESIRFQNKYIVLAISTILFVTSCQPSEKAIQTAVAETQQAMPTVSPTKIPVSELDIQDILIQPGDLPGNYEAGQKLYDWPTDFGLPMVVKPDNLVMQMFKEKGDSFNIPHFALLALYSDINNVSKAYSEIVYKLDFKTITPSVVGEKSSLMRYNTGSKLLNLDVLILVYKHCNSLVVIRTYNWDETNLFAFAKGLDKRVEKIACQ